MRETVTQRVLVRTLVWRAHLAFLLTLLVGSEGGRVEAKDEVKNNPPQISSVFPQGARCGSQLEGVINGQNLSRTTKIIFSEPGVSGRLLKTTNTKVWIKLEVEPEASIGPHYFRLVTPRGISNLLIFRVGELLEKEEAEPNDTFEKANRIQTPVTINARMGVDEDIDMYRLRAEAGEHLIFDLLAARNGSGGDLALTLLDARGHIVKHSEDHFIWDPFISFIFKEAGEYFLAVRPLDGRGSPDFAYQLTIRPGPYLASIFPLGAQQGTSFELMARGLTLAGAKRIEVESRLGKGLEITALSSAADAATSQVNVAKDVPLGVYHLRLLTPAGWSNPVKFFVGDLPELIEAEPNDAPGQLQRVGIPATINGRIERKGDVDQFAFKAGACDQLIFEMKAEELGSPLDGRLTLYDSKGNELASNDDADPNNRLNRDARLEFSFLDAGDYSLAIRDLSRLGGPHYGYRLTIRKPAPSFSINFDSDRPIVERDGAGALKITAKRWEGFDGEIQLEVLGLPKTISAGPAVIKKGETQTSITLKCESGATPEVFPIRVVGEAKINDQSVKQLAGMQVRISGVGPGFTTTQITEAPLAITEPVNFNLEVGATQVPLVRGSAAEFTVTARRRAGFKTAIALMMENLPTGVTAEEVQIREDGNHAVVKLKASEAAKVGRYLDVAIVGKARVGDHEEIEQSPRITLRID
ncbi:MAG TPA: hypothetical protein VJ810_16490 [Blastocatellia bacterium]|nr:hypothetical protein [Blastocatellia bacterium]